MRVAIDARKLHDFGIGTYIRNLLKQLARLDQTTEYVLLTRQSDLAVASQLGPNFRSVLEPSPNYSIREQIHVPWVLMREKPDVFHAPHYILPTGVRAHSVVTIHDCIHLMFPQYLPNRMSATCGRSVIFCRRSGRRPATRPTTRLTAVARSARRTRPCGWNVWFSKASSTAALRTIPIQGAAQ